MGVIQPATFLVVGLCLKSDGSTSHCLHAYGQSLDTMATPFCRPPLSGGGYRENRSKPKCHEEKRFFLCDRVTWVSHDPVHVPRDLAACDVIC